VSRDLNVESWSKEHSARNKFASVTESHQRKPLTNIELFSNERYSLQNRSLEHIQDRRLRRLVVKLVLHVNVLCIMCPSVLGLEEVKVHP
jgi:hypothetical protein